MAYDFSKLSILVVEDLDPMSEILVTILEHMGVKDIYTAKDGEEGYASFLRHRPDLIITDWLMEPVNGLEMVRWIRHNKLSHDRMVPVIVMTGYTASHRVMEARDEGVTEFIAKPFTASQLINRITHIINRPRDFIETTEFSGPDRRRKKHDGFNGANRRKNEAGEVWS